MARKPQPPPDSVRLHDMHDEIERKRQDEKRATFLRKCIRLALDIIPEPKGPKNK